MAKEETKKKIKNEPVVSLTEELPSKTTHTVTEGETLSEIATKYRLSLRKLLTLNDLSSPDVEAGVQLVVE